MNRLLLTFISAVLILIVPTMAQEENYYINITSPGHNDGVQWRTWIEGNTNLSNDINLNIYTFIKPIGTSSWWVQPDTELHQDGRWECYAYFGRKGMDYDTWYYICAIITSLELIEGDVFSELPEHIAESDCIKVIRL